MTTTRGRKPRLASRTSPPLSPSNELLLRLLTAQSRREGLTLKQLASRLGVSYSMIDKLRSHEALLARSSDEVLDAVAKFLGVPQVFVRLLSGALSLDAFQWPGSESIEASVLNHALAPSDDWLPGHPRDAALHNLRVLQMAAMLEGDWQQAAGYLKRTQQWLEDWAEVFSEHGAPYRE